MESASRAAGLSSDGAEMLRLGENAIYRLAHDPAVVRIARSAARMNTAQRELCVAQWLERNAIPTVKVYGIENQPLLIEGYPVTFWRAVSGPNGGPEPRVLVREDLDPQTIRVKRWQNISALSGARAWLFVLPSSRVVAAFSIDVTSELADIVDLLEDCYFCDVHVGETLVTDTMRRLIASLDGQAIYDEDLLPERHQLIFSEHPSIDDCEEIVQHLVYRANLPYKKEYSVINYPPELNRRPGWMAAVGPYVSVVCGQADFIENTVFLSAVHGVAAAAELRAIRHAAYQDVKLFRPPDRDEMSTQKRRKELERTADNLKNLEIELSYSVEAPADLGLLVPSLRVESFHNALFESMDLSAKAATVSRMLQRLERAINAELTSIESAERRADEERRLRWGIAIGFLSAVAVPSGIILAYFGINANQVNPNRSIFDHHYLPVYVTVFIVMMIGGLLSFFLYLQQSVRNRRQQRE
jgi:hypothetical protein